MKKGSKKAWLLSLVDKRKEPLPALLLGGKPKESESRKKKKS